jgi:hypothetical protein
MQHQNEENYAPDSGEAEGERSKDGPQNVPAYGRLWTDEVRRLISREPLFTDLLEKYPPIQAEILGVHCEVKPTALYLALVKVPICDGTSAAKDAYRALVRKVRTDLIMAAHRDATRGVWKRCRERALTPWERAMGEMNKASRKSLEGRH